MTIFSYLQNLWQFPKWKSDDLQVSAKFVQQLSIPEQTKHFVFALREPDSNAVVYILAAQNLSEQAALDAELLIKQVQPKAVVTQIAPSVLAEIQAEEKCSNSDKSSHVPTSSFEVLRRCFIDKINKEQYDTFAGFQVVREIFGVGFYGQFLAAKAAATEVNAHFVVLESPYESACATPPAGVSSSGDQSSGLQLQGSCLLPGNVNSSSYTTFRRFCLTNNLQEEMVKALIPSLELLISASNFSETGSEAALHGSKPSSDFQVPPFAKSVYPLLEDLYSIFTNLPSMGKALASAQQLLVDVDKGGPVNVQLLSEVQNFRIAIESLRIALNDAGRGPIDRKENGSLTRLEFSELSSEEKCHALFAQSVRNEAKKYGTVVAIVDVANLSGLRKYWNTSVPQEFLEFSTYDNEVKAHEDATTNQERKRKLLADKPVVAVGAGATAVFGASSLSKALPASTLVKVTTFKIPASLKFGFVHLQRTVLLGINKILGSVMPGVSSFGTKSSTLKAAVSAEKIRSVTHSVVASAQRTTLLAIRTSFYEIMRRRHVKSVKVVPCVTFGCSMAACAGLLAYGDGIECAAESIPSVPTITALGQGLLDLRQASEQARQSNGTKIRESLQSLAYNLKKMKVN